MTNDSDRSDDDACASPKPNDVESKLRVRVSPGDNHLATEEAERVVAATDRYYESGGALVRVINRPGQGVSVERVHEQTLKSLLSQEIYWERKAQGDVWVRCDPPYGVVQALLHGQDRHHLQTLNGLARQPHFDNDGRLIGSPGYDAGTGIFGAFDESDFQLDEATPELAMDALHELESIVSEFDFETALDRSTALSAMLMAAVRSALPVAPAVNITAAGPGSGKSSLADCIVLVAGPEDIPRVSFPESQDEAAKLLITVLRERPPAVLFDDMQGNWKSLGPLNRALTSSTTTERLLRTNNSATVSTRVLFIGTGNNSEAERDMRRRLLTIRLAPRMETPALRSFRVDPVVRVRNDRAKVVKCALNIIRAFKAAGEPITNVRPVGSYEAWSRYCRHPLIWLGHPDPAQSLIDQLADDPDQDCLAEFLAAWHSQFGEQSVTVRRLLAKAGHHDPLMEALEELPVHEGRHVSPNKLGWYISKRRGRRAGGLRIEKGDLSERKSWRVIAG